MAYELNFHTRNFLVSISIFLITAICYKTAVPLSFLFVQTSNELTMTTETDEKKTETESLFDKTKAFSELKNLQLAQALTLTCTVRFAVLKIVYKSLHFPEILIPPPELCKTLR